MQSLLSFPLLFLSRQIIQITRPKWNISYGFLSLVKWTNFLEMCFLFMISQHSHTKQPKGPDLGFQTGAQKIGGEPKISSQFVHQVKKSFHFVAGTHRWTDEQRAERQILFQINSSWRPSKHTFLKKDNIVLDLIWLQWCTLKTIKLFSLSLIVFLLKKCNARVGVH